MVQKVAIQEDFMVANRHLADDDEKKKQEKEKKDQDVRLNRSRLL